MNRPKFFIDSLLEIDDSMPVLERMEPVHSPILNQVRDEQPDIIFISSKHPDVADKDLKSKASGNGKMKYPVVDSGLCSSSVRSSSVNTPILVDLNQVSDEQPDIIFISAKPPGVSNQDLNSKASGTDKMKFPVVDSGPSNSSVHRQTDRCQSVRQIGFGLTKFAPAHLLGYPDEDSSSRKRRVVCITGEGAKKRARYNTYENVASEVESLREHEFYRIMREATGSSTKFLGGKFSGTFMLLNFSKCLDPEATLREIFQYSIDKAITETAKLGEVADRLIICISSASIQYDITVGIQEINSDTVENILHRFQVVENSNKGKDGASLHNTPFTVDVTAFALEGLKKKVTKQPSKTTGSGRNLVFHPNIRMSALHIIDNSDNLCLFRAINFLRARTTMPNGEFRYYKVNDGRQLADIKLMMHILKIPQNLATYAVEDVVPKIQNYYDEHYSSEKFKIFVFNDVNGHTPVFTSKVRFFKTPLAIYHHNKHFDAIPAITSFFNCDKGGFCLFCYTPYKTQYHHKVKCEARCLNCCKINYEYGRCQFQYGFEETCKDCGKVFNNLACYLRHLERKLCERSKRCPDCGVIYDVKVNTKNGRSGHVCIEKHCHTCQGFHEPRKCDMQVLKVKPEEDYRIIVFDYESTQDIEVEPGTMKFDHQVNFISATVICTVCIANDRWNQPLSEECVVCGKDRTFAWTRAMFNETEVDCQYVTENPLRDFTKWILYHFNDGPQQKYYSVALSHFGGRYDMVLLFGEIFRLGGLTPNLVKQGNKLYELTVKKRGMVTETYFRDTFNLFPVALDKLPKTFDLKNVENKLFFPHLFNKVSNMRKVLPHLPPPEDYLHNAMKVDKRAKFDLWYEANKHKSFNLREKVAEYCCADVNILVSAIVEMRQLFDNITGQDILQKVTIASACMDHFLASHLKADHLPIIPEQGYEKVFKQSSLARKFLKWCAHDRDLVVQDSESPEGEKQLGPYHLDGYVQRPGKKDLAIEVYGCYWHACPKHYPNDQTVVAGGQTAEMVRKRNELRANYIKRSMDLLEVWECDIYAMLAIDPEMKEFFAKTFDSGAISLRDGFFGGRTGPEKMFAEATNGRSIGYMDIMSLYPSINFNGSYPVKHPKPMVYNKHVNWTKSEDNPYKGIIKCLVVPPRYDPNNPIIPVLPVRLEGDSRLLFPLCKTCASENKIGCKNIDYSCPHDDPEDRAFVVTATHPELNKALDRGYVVIRLYRTYEFEEFDSDLFKGYVREMMAIKIQASGWPPNCVSEEFKDDLPDESVLTDEQKAIVDDLKVKRAIFILETKEKYGIELDYSKIKRNEGLRYIAKLCLNSLWGRFSLRNNLSKSVIVDRPEKLVELLTDPSIEVLTQHQLNEDALMLTMKTVEEFVREHKTSNVVLSLWTTSLARLHLLKFLELLNERSDVEILYMDTDSVIYSYLTEKENPIIPGDHLGDMTDEYEDYDILKFVSGGCKQYGLAIRLKGKPDAPIEYVIKCRGITLDHETSLRLTFEEFERRILSFGDSEEPLVLTYQMLRPDVARGRVLTVKMDKIYQPVISKGIVVDNYRVAPFGYVKK